MMEATENRLADLADQAMPANDKEQPTNGDESGDRQQLIVFSLAEENFAIPIDSIREVVLTPSISRVPQSPPYVEGVANIRGTIITIINLEKRLSMLMSVEGAGEAKDRYRYTLVLEVGGKNVGILVDRVPNTLNVKSEDINAADEAMSAQIADSRGSYLRGIVNYNDKMIFLLNIADIL